MKLKDEGVEPGLEIQVTAGVGDGRAVRRQIPPPPIGGSGRSGGARAEGSGVQKRYRMPADDKASEETAVGR